MSGGAYFVNNVNGQATISRLGNNNPLKVLLNSRKIIRLNVGNTNIKKYISLGFNRNNSNSNDKRKKFIEIVFNVYLYISARIDNTPRGKIIEKLSKSILKLAVYLAKNNTPTLDKTLKSIFGKKNNGTVTEIREKTFRRALNIIKANNNRKVGLTNNNGNKKLNITKASQENDTKNPKLSRYNIILGVLGDIVERTKGPPSGQENKGPPSGQENKGIQIGTSTQQEETQTGNQGTTQTGNNVNELNKIMEEILNSNENLIKLGNGNNGSRPPSGNESINSIMGKTNPQKYKKNNTSINSALEHLQVLKNKQTNASNGNNNRLESRIKQVIKYLVDKVESLSDLNKVVKRFTNLNIVIDNNMKTNINSKRNQLGPNGG